VTTRLIDGGPTISVYPNPAQEYITIEIKNPRKNLRVYNYWGQEFNLPIRFFDEKIQIDIRSIPTGIYMISSAFDGGLFKSTTFIKQ
jgi:hypothetical protein